MSENWTVKNIPDQSEKIVIITGANSGICYESAREFTRKGAEGKTTLVAAVWNEVKTFWAWVTGAPPPDPEARKIIASAEAGIGGGVSYDGGTTWQGFMVPGGPNDITPASLAHPGKQLNPQG